MELCRTVCVIQSCLIVWLNDGISKSLYADDGTLWIRGRNLQNKLQAVVETVEQWANKWDFSLSVTKTQVICFAKRHKKVSIKLYGQTLAQVKVFFFF